MVHVRSCRPAVEVAALLAFTLAGCGGGGSTTPAPVPTPSAAPTAAPTPTPTPTPDPRDGWAVGPVTQVKAYLKTIESEKASRQYRDGVQDADGNWIVYVGEYVVIDSTQRNGAGQICRWVRDPVYDYVNSENMMEVTGSSEPFFLKFTVFRAGTAEVQSEIDGIKSNVLKIKGVRK